MVAALASAIGASFVAGGLAKGTELTAHELKRQLRQRRLSTDFGDLATEFGTAMGTAIEEEQAQLVDEADSRALAPMADLDWNEVGAMSAMRHAGETCVTVKISEPDLKRPVPQGNTCVIESYAYAAGRTSVRVRLRAFRESPRAGERELTTDSYFVFVAAYADGSPTPVPELTVEGNRCHELRNEALAAELDA